MTEEVNGVVGFAVFFENIVFYVTRFGDLIRTIGKKKKTGEYLGTVLCVIPQSSCYVLYEYIRHSKGYLQRQAERRCLKRLRYYGGRSMMQADKKKGQKELKRWLHENKIVP